MPSSSLGRILLVVLAIWLVVSVVALWLFFSGGEVPGSGEAL